MKLLELIRRVRTNTRDLTNSIFREQDIVDFINEGVNRFKQIIPELRDVDRLIDKQQEVTLIPEEYHHLLAVYATSRCFAQDERHYQSTTFMNEFEIKLEKLKQDIDSGIITIIDKDGNEVSNDYNKPEYVDLEAYWGKRPKREW